MTKKDLVWHVAKTLKISRAQAAKIVDVTIEVIIKALSEGDRISLGGLGTFSVSQRAVRTGRNPQTGKAILFGPKKIAKFKAGAELLKVLSLVPDDVEEDDTEDTGPMRR